jgi:NAD(P)-dependent dehydrogenase (short-subunit alcohol dehydrogenase family)
MFTLHDRVAVVTGAARGIGMAVLVFALPTARAITNQVLALDAGFSIT